MCVVLLVLFYDQLLGSEGGKCMLDSRLFIDCAHRIDENPSWLFPVDSIATASKFPNAQIPHSGGEANCLCVVRLVLFYDRLLGSGGGKRRWRRGITDGDCSLSNPGIQSEL